MLPSVKAQASLKAQTVVLDRITPGISILKVMRVKSTDTIPLAPPHASMQLFMYVAYQQQHWWMQRLSLGMWLGGSPGRRRSPGQAPPRVSSGQPQSHQRWLGPLHTPHQCPANMSTTVHLESCHNYCFKQCILSLQQ